MTLAHAGGVAEPAAPTEVNPGVWLSGVFRVFILLLSQQWVMCRIPRLIIDPPTLWGEALATFLILFLAGMPVFIS